MCVCGGGGALLCVRGGGGHMCAGVGGGMCGVGGGGRACHVEEGQRVAGCSPLSCAGCQGGQADSRLLM